MIQRQPGDCLSDDVVKGRLNARVLALDFRPADSIRRRPPSAERALLSRLFRSMESSALGSAEQRDLEPRSEDRR